MLLVQRRLRFEVSEVEFAAEVDDALPEHVERPALLDFFHEPFEELLLRVLPVLLLQPVPHRHLCGVDEVEERAGVEAKSFVVALRFW